MTTSDGKEITSTNYVQFFVEDVDDEYRRRSSRKSNLIMNLKHMSREEKSKAARIIIDDELFLAGADLSRHGSKGPIFAANHLASAMHVEKDVNVKHDPPIDNPAVREAWEKRDPKIILAIDKHVEIAKKRYFYREDTET